MITVQEARSIIWNHAGLLNAIEIAADQCLGYVLSEDIISAVDVPCFWQSSMDGYALESQHINHSLPVQDELPAGSSRKIHLKPYHAVKVFTGGPVPDGADIVVQREWIEQAADGTIFIHPQKITDHQIAPGLNIRKPGSDIGIGYPAIAAGTKMNAAQIALLASLGITRVKVYRKPVVAIVITGNELVVPGSPLEYGQVYESNSFGLKAALESAGVAEVNISYAKDELNETAARLNHAVSTADIVLLTGGVSVGEYDFVSGACVKEGVELLFHGVKQRPGKPLLFGRKGEKLIFGLPGNPSSVLSCYQQYVLPAILKLSGRKEPQPVLAKLGQAYEKKGVLGVFLKGYLKNGVVHILPAQASYQLSAFAAANCWIELDESISFFDEMQLVPVHLI